MSETFNPFTGTIDFLGSNGTGSSPDNFSKQTVSAGQTATIPVGQEMLLKSPLVNRGVVINRGIIRFVKDDVEQMGHFNFIPAGKVAVVAKNKSMFFKRILRVAGILRNHGIVEGI